MRLSCVQSARLAGQVVLVASLGALVTACSSGGSQSQATMSPAQLKTASAAYANQDAAALRNDAKAMTVAHELYLTNCASCHQADGTGGRKVTNLTLGRYNYGTSAAAIHTTISQGRKSVMPSSGDLNLGEVDLGQLVAYVASLSTPSTGKPTLYEQRGKVLFAKDCASCHGDDGKGNTAIGAPDLTDSYWLGGSSKTAIRLNIASGMKSETPAFQGKLDEPEMQLLTAYVLNLMPPSTPKSGS